MRGTGPAVVRVFCPAAVLIIRDCVPASASLPDFLAKSDALERAAAAAFAAASNAETLEEARIEFLGDVRGRLREMQGALREIAKDDKPAAGKRFNSLKEHLEVLLAERHAFIRGSSGAETESVDLTMPGRDQWRGPDRPRHRLHPELQAHLPLLRYTRPLMPGDLQHCKALRTLMS